MSSALIVIAGSVILSGGDPLPILVENVARFS